MIKAAVSSVLVAAHDQPRLKAKRYRFSQKSLGKRAFRIGIKRAAGACRKDHPTAALSGCLKFFEGGADRRGALFVGRGDLSPHA